MGIWSPFLQDLSFSPSPENMKKCDGPLMASGQASVESITKNEKKKKLVRRSIPGGFRLELQILLKFYLIAGRDIIRHHMSLSQWLSVSPKYRSCTEHTRHNLCSLRRMSFRNLRRVKRRRSKSKSHGLLQSDLHSIDLVRVQGFKKKNSALSVDQVFEVSFHTF